MSSVQCPVSSVQCPVYSVHYSVQCKLIRFSCLNHLNLTVFNNLVHFQVYLNIFQQHCCHPQKITYYYLQQGIKIELAIITKLFTSLGGFSAVNVHSS